MMKKKNLIIIYGCQIYCFQGADEGKRDLKMYIQSIGFIYFSNNYLKIQNSRILSLCPWRAYMYIICVPVCNLLFVRKHSIWSYVYCVLVRSVRYLRTTTRILLLLLLNILWEFWNFGILKYKILSLFFFVVPVFCDSHIIIYSIYEHFGRLFLILTIPV